MKRKRGSQFLGVDEYRPMEEEDEEKSGERELKRRRLDGDDNGPLMFYQVCDCLNMIEKSKKQKKEQIFQAFLYYNRTRDFFPFIRLMIPSLDRQRAAIGLKERKLGDIYSEVAMISQEQRKNLKSWKAKGKDVSTKFADHIYSLLRNVGWKIDQSKKIQEDAMTVREINDWLDSLGRLEKKTYASYKSKLEEIMFRLSALEHKFLVCMMLKQMKIECGDNTLLGFIHEDAKLLYQREPNLENLCIRVKDGVNLRLEDHKIKPFMALKPMLAMKGHPTLLDKFMTDKKTGKRSKLYYEPKFDGERVLIHFSEVNHMESTPRIEYYTRRGNNFTRYYDKFNPHVIQCLHKRFKNCILDGEMLVYDTNLSTLKEFGTNRKHAVEQPDHEHFCYQCFDIICCDGTETTNLYPYIQRKGLLRKKIRPKKTYFEVVQEESVGTKEEINRKLREAVEEGCEGIMLKKALSMYHFDQRRGWMKYKPYYLESLDLLILGCWYGTKFNRLSPSDFLMGVRENSRMLPGSSERKKKNSTNIIIPPPPPPITTTTTTRNSEDFLSSPPPPPPPPEEEEEEEEEGEKICKFYTLTKVGTGFNKQELGSLQSHLDQHWVDYNPSRPPSWLAGLPPPAAAEKYTPDFVIDDPRNSQVITVKCDAVVDTEKYGMKFTLRHGRAVKVRYDKSWDNCCDRDGFAKFQRSIKIAHRKHYNSDMSPIVSLNGIQNPLFYEENGNNKRKRKIRKTEEPTVPRAFMRAVNPSEVEAEGQALAGQEFMIANWEVHGGMYKDKACLEKIILGQGGSVTMVARPRKTDGIIASRRDFRVRNYISTKLYDVIHPEWLLEIRDKGRPVPLRRDHLLFPTDQTLRDISERVDQYGDVFTERMTIQDFKRFRSQMFPEKSTTTEVLQEEEENVNTIIPPPPPPPNNNNQQSQQQKKKKEISIKRNLVEKLEKRFGEKRRKKNKKPVLTRSKSVTIFRHKVFYLDAYEDPGDLSTKIPYSVMEVMNIIIDLHAGIITQHLNHHHIDYVVMDRSMGKKYIEKKLRTIQNLLPRDRKKIIVVDVEWIRLCSRVLRLDGIEPYLIRGKF